MLFFISFSCYCFGSSRYILLAYFYLNMDVNASFWKPDTWVNLKTAFGDSEKKSQLKTQMAVNVIVFVYQLCISSLVELAAAHTQRSYL